MKNRASALVKKIISTLTEIVKSKTTAFKNRTKAFKTRLVIFSLIYNRKFLISSISQKLNSLIIHDKQKPNSEEEDYKEEEEEEELFEDGEGGSVIDLVKKSKLEGRNEGEEFRLEDEIDRVADLFIERFHRQMRLQKQLSFEDDTPPHA